MLKQTVATRRDLSDLPRRIEWVIAVGAIAFLAVSIFFVRELYLSLAAKGWPSVEGNITRVEYVSSGKGKKPVPQYRYEVNGTAHTGSGFGFGWPDSWPGFSETFESLHHRGPARVYYDPGNPSRSSLWNLGPTFPLWAFGLSFPLGVPLFTYGFILIRRGRREAANHLIPQRARAC